MITELTASNFRQAAASDKPLVIEFYSPTCVHCKKTEVGLKELSEEMKETAKFAKCDVTAEAGIAEQYDITALPTLLFIRNGDIKERLVGFTHKLIIAENLKKL